MNRGEIRGKIDLAFDIGGDGHIKAALGRRMTFGGRETIALDADRAATEYEIRFNMVAERNPDIEPPEVTSIALADWWIELAESECAE